jgi:hypothetical protein
MASCAHACQEWGRSACEPAVAQAPLHRAYPPLRSSGGGTRPPSHLPETACAPHACIPFDRGCSTPCPATAGPLLADVGAGITVGVVALPLAMAFAIASGVKPEQGLFTAIIAGLLISALGGSHVQIGGPAGAFIVIVYGIVERYGLANLLISTAMAGVLLFLMGWFKLGALVRYVPVAIVIGFTNGIAVLIGLSQVKDFFGLTTPKLPGDFFALLAVLAQHAHTVNPWAVAIASASLAVVVLWPKSYAMPTGRRSAWPARRRGPRPTCRAPSSRWWGPRWPSRCCTCRWRPSARASAASRRRCRRWRCPTSAGPRPSSW